MSVVNNFIENQDYYLENGRVIFTSSFLSKRKEGCCGNNCRHCPFIECEKGIQELKT